MLLANDPAAGFLTPWWQDVIAVFSLVGLFLTLLGLVLTWIQVNNATTAANAAKEASDQALRDSRQRFLNLIVTRMHTLARGAQDYIHRKEWASVAIRLHDLADDATQLSHHLSQEAEIWRRMATVLTKTATSCSDTVGEPPRNRIGKWKKVLAEVREKLRPHQPTV